MTNDNLGQEKHLRHFTHIVIPAEIWLRRDIHIQSKALWAELRSLHDKSRGGCYASDEYLMEFLGLKRTRLHELFKELKDVGLMEIVSFNGRQIVRKALVPAIEYEESGQQLSAKADTSYPEKRTPDVRFSGFPPYIENKEEKKEYIEENPPPSISRNSVKKSIGRPPTIPKTKHGNFVELRHGEYEELCQSLSKVVVDYYIESINNYVPNAKPYKDYAAAIKQWHLKDKKNGTLPDPEKLKKSSISFDDHVEMIEKRKAWVRNFIIPKIYEKNPDERIRESSEYIQFINPKANTESDRIYFKDGKFEELLKHEMRKRNLT